MDDILAKLGQGGRDGLAIRLPRQSFKTGAIALRAQSGYILFPDRIEEWRVETFAESEEWILVSGPAFAGRSLDEAGSPEEGLSLLARSAAALGRLSALKLLPKGLLSAGILCGDGEVVLVLPPEFVARSFASLDPERRDRAAAHLASPRAESAEDEASFLLAQAAYRFATGKPAFSRLGDDRGETHIARGGFLPVSLEAPRLEPALAGMIDRVLADPRGIGLGEWEGALAEARALGWFRSLPEAEAERLERSRRARVAAMARAGARAAFFRRRRGALIAAAIALGIAAAYVGSVLSAARSKPDYSGRPPREIVDLYYEAIDGLSTDSIEACGTKDAVRADYDMATNLFLISKMRMAYEGGNPLVRAEDWLARGRPELGPAPLLFGIAGLGIEELSLGRDEAAYRAAYSLWSMERKGEDSSAPRESRRVDLLSLSRSAKGWKIVKIERTESN
jgi:hypothetical protein